MRTTQSFSLLFLLMVLPVISACKPKAKPAPGDANKSNLSLSIDGEFDDWTGAQPLAVDPPDDATGRFDLRSVWAQADNELLFVSFALKNGTEFNLQNGEESDGAFQLTIHEDDNVQHIKFRKRQLINSAAPGQIIPWTPVEFTCLPTYASERYELQIKLLDAESKIRIEFSGSDSLDQAITVPRTTAQRPTAKVDLQRAPSSDFRIANLNTLNNGLSDPERSKTIHRLMTGAQADVYTLQEEWDPKGFYGALKPLGATMGIKRLNARWGSGCGIISERKIEKLDMDLDRAIGGLIELDSGKHLVVMSVHFKSRGHVGTEEDGLRIQHANQLASEIKRMREGAFGEEAKNACVIVVGDYNLVGSREPIDILNQAGLEDVIFKNPKTGTAYTWRDDTTTFPPSRLDWLCQSGAEPLKTIVLNTETLDEDVLSENNLQKTDSNGTDHLMLIGDFRFKQQE